MTVSEFGGIAAPVLATAVGLGAALTGVWLSGAHQRAKVAVPFSAGVLLGVALFGLVPHLAVDSGWGAAVILFAAGYGVLLLVNRFVYPVCPTCSHDHDHHACAAELHGIGWPLITAAAIHSFMDGWSVASTQLAVPLGLRVAVPLAVVLHKAPEGIALGGVVRAAMKTRTEALVWCLLAEGATLVGGIVALWVAPHLGSQWIVYPLGIMAGWLFFLGQHAVHSEWKRRGAAPVMKYAFGGIVLAAAVLQGADVMLGH